MNSVYNTIRNIETTHKVNYITGETVETEEKKVIKVSKTPDFVMLFLNDIQGLYGLTEGQTKCIYSILKFVVPTNLLNLTGYIYQQLAEELNVSVQQIRNWISQLTKKEILYRKGSGTYLLNPYLFGKGNWNDVQKLRLEIVYTEKKGRQIKLFKSKKNNE